MSRKRANECHDQYTEDTEIVAIFLKKEGKKFKCEETWLETPEPDEKHRYTLFLYNFTRIAKYLAKMSAFSVPTHIMDAVDRVIELRSECNRIHKRLTPGMIAENKRHKYPIQVFQKIREILLPKLSAGSSIGMQSLPGKH